VVMESGEMGMDRSALIRVIKFVTLILGVMIVIALGLIGYRLYFHTTVPAPTQQHENGAAPVMVPSNPTSNVEYSQIPLNQPVGSTVARTAAQGSWLFLTITGGGVPDRVVVVDVAQGRVISTVGLGGVDTLPPRAER